MKHRLIILFAACSLLTATGMRAASSADSLRRYYGYVYQAEQELIHGSYRSASLYFDSALQTGVRPFAMDAYNAAICAAYNNNNEEISRYARLLILKGADTAFFRKTVFRGFRQSKEWSRLAAEFPVLKAKRAAQLDYDLISTLQHLCDRDQEMHGLLRENYGDADVVSRVTRVDDSLSEVLNRLMLANDYLSEDKIGADFEEDTSLSIWPLYGIIALHHFEGSSLRCDTCIYRAPLKETVMEAMRRGKVKPEIGLGWVEYGRYGLKLYHEYFIINDTLRKNTLAHIIQQHAYRMHSLLHDTCSVARGYTDACYLDKGENIASKVRYNYSRSLKRKKGIPFKDEFLIYAMLGNWGQVEWNADNNDFWFKTSEVVDYAR